MATQQFHACMWQVLDLSKTMKLMLASPEACAAAAAATKTGCQFCMERLAQQASDAEQLQSSQHEQQHHDQSMNKQVGKQGLQIAFSLDSCDHASNCCSVPLQWLHSWRLSAGFTQPAVETRTALHAQVVHGHTTA